jgi:hypothetical protein
MIDREEIIAKIRSLPDDLLKEVAEFIRRLEEEKRKKDVISDVIGICEGPPDLAERHDKYVYG